MTGAAAADGPLSNVEADELGAFLMSDARSEDAMEISGLHGFLTAIVSGPAVIMPTEWLPIVLESGESPLANIEQAQRICGLIMRLYNEIIFTLTEAPELFDPILIGRPDERTPRYYGCAWVRGYVEGMQLRIDEWSPYFREPVVERNLTTITRFAEDLPNEPLPRGVRRGQVPEVLAEAAHAIHAFFLKLRNRERIVRRSSPRVGRNAPCPCGSGKKFKVCCGAT